MNLPADFIRETRALMGEERYAQLVAGLQEEAPVSIRLNPFKCDAAQVEIPLQAGRVPWCRDGVYLQTRPNFTQDPSMHAGLYYVQEASSMFVSHVLRQHVHEPVLMLDLCAAPGGKSISAMATLPQGSMLLSNEPMRNRVQVLSENIQKFGHPHMVVTNNYPRDYRKAKLQFDVILCDVPCSGEGMFRKDSFATSDWSLRKVADCQRLQREILEQAWHCLRPGGLLIYSTCTFNQHENEENLQWLCQQTDAEVLPVDIDASWHIVGSLLPGFAKPVCRFIPGLVQGEGLFMAVLRKGGEAAPAVLRRPNLKGLSVVEPTFQNTLSQASTVPHADLSYTQAVSYLRREALVLPPAVPRGLVAVTWHHHVLGLVKNLGTRANNLYPKEWRIRTTYLDAPQQVLRFPEPATPAAHH